jgi:hypothetical protein
MYVMLINIVGRIQELFGRRGEEATEGNSGATRTRQRVKNSET